MGREVRKVPADWVHPKDEYGHGYIPMYDEDYAIAAAEFLEMANSKGLQEAVDYYGFPEKDRYMPAWPDELRTHFMMYENTSEGTPISPAFATAEELARWLADNNASAFGSATATYDAWLRVCRGGYAPSAVYTPESGLQSGVQALSDHDATPGDSGRG